MIPILPKESGYNMADNYEQGWIYCLSNDSYEGQLKIGITMKEPDVRAKQLYTTGVPTAFTVEFAKKVMFPAEKEKTIHKLLAQYTERVNPRREFFYVSVDEVRTFFELMDGEWWNKEEVEEDESEESDEEVKDDSSIKRKSECQNTGKKGRGRDMKKYFRDGLAIRHIIGVTKIWEGVYNEEQDSILSGGEIYNSPSNFAKNHYISERPNRPNSNANGWKECECKIDGKWVKAYNLPTLK
jgi:hypothetical protein